VQPGYLADGCFGLPRTVESAVVSGHRTRCWYQSPGRRTSLSAAHVKEKRSPGVRPGLSGTAIEGRSIGHWSLRTSFHWRESQVGNFQHWEFDIHLCRPPSDSPQRKFISERHVLGRLIRSEVSREQRDDATHPSCSPGPRPQAFFEPR